MEKAQALFDKIATNKQHIVIAELPIYLRSQLAAFARVEGIVDGKLTKEQFLKFATRSRFGRNPLVRPPRDTPRITITPESMFDRIAKGKKSISLNDVPVFIRQRLQDYLKSKGKKTDHISREDFIEYYKTRRLGFTNPRPERPPFNGARTPKTTKEFNDYVDRTASSYFKSRDKNKDGFLDDAELSQRLKENLKQFDKNVDGKINREEARGYISSP